MADFMAAVQRLLKQDGGLSVLGVQGLSGWGKTSQLGEVLFPDQDNWDGVASEQGLGGFIQLTSQYRVVVGTLEEAVKFNPTKNENCLVIIDDIHTYEEDDQKVVDALLEIQKKGSSVIFTCQERHYGDLESPESVFESAGIKTTGVLRPELLSEGDAPRFAQKLVDRVYQEKLQELKNLGWSKEEAPVGGRELDGNYNNVVNRIKRALLESEANPRECLKALKTYFWKCTKKQAILDISEIRFNSESSFIQKFTEGVEVNE